MTPLKIAIMNADKIRDIDTVLYAVGIHYDPVSELYYRGTAAVEPRGFADLLGLSWDRLRNCTATRRGTPETQAAEINVAIERGPNGRT